MDDPAARRTYSYLVLGALSTTYLLNFIDRQLLSVLAEPIRRDLHLSDTQIGALGGLMFALFYTVFGIPLAMLADRWNRVRLIALACAIWSLFSAASGLAAGFFTLAMARMGVGFGEAGCAPPSLSIIADYFPPARRGTASAIYSLGIPLGSLFGVAAGARIAALYGWRSAFVSVGAFGLVAAPLLVLVVREPSRGRYDPPAQDGAAGSRDDSPLAAFKVFARSPILMLTALSAGVNAFVAFGLLNWAPAYLQRVQGMTLGEMAAVYSVVLGAAMGVGTFSGGYLVDRLGARAPAAYALVPAVAMFLAAPCIWGFTAARGWPSALVILAAPLALTLVYLAPALAVVQNRTPARRRATVTAMLLFFLNLIGLGGGPLFVGLVSDHLAPTMGHLALGAALRWLTPFAILSSLLHCACAWSTRSEARQSRAYGAPVVDAKLLGTAD